MKHTSRRLATVLAACLALMLGTVGMAWAQTTATIYLGSSYMKVYMSGSQIDKVQMNNTGCPTGTALVGGLDYNGDGRFDETFSPGAYSPWGLTEIGGPFHGSITHNKTRAQLQCGSKISSIYYF